ncbi:MAG: hypothetical protein A3G20_00585 [Acidobacteria bacterium RIFCSPLOWO2_12_FULL_59_11]|nr:MAG: hypothetical protein A3G20_00585 [Acidobacteria bacterium RIFCSPLOWO2_12_FULL_59_11]
MKKGTICCALMIATFLGGGAIGSPWATLAQAQGQAPQASPWKDRAEYDAFNAMAQATDSNQRVELADKYLAAYPETKFADKVYEFKLQAYQQLNNTPKMEEAATKLVEIKPDHFAALFILSYLIPRTLNAQDPAMDQKLTKAADYAQRGLTLLDSMQKPESVSAEQFQQQKQQQTAVFHQTAGFVSLQKKGYEKAAEELRKSAELDPKDALVFYWLGLSYLSPKPPNYDQGIWAMARAVSITGPNALPAPTLAEVKSYLTKFYISRHGDEQGLEDILAQATTSPSPPPDFHVAAVEEQERFQEQAAPPPPVVRELTVKPEELSSFDDIRKYLQAGGQKEEDTWTLLHEQVLPLPGKVISATPANKPQTLRLAVSPDTVAQDGRYDVEVVLGTPLSAPLEKGQDIEIEGKIDAYTAKPFLLRFVEGKVTKK